MFYTVFVHTSFPNNTLIAWTGGKYSRIMEMAKPQDVVDAFMKVLRKYTGIKDIPEPVELIRYYSS